VRAVEMKQDDLAELQPKGEREGYSLWRLSMQRFRRHKLALVGLVLMAAITFLAISGPGLRPFRSDKPDYKKLFKPPDWAHWFGTDELGRDLFVRVMEGGRVSLLVGVAGASSSAFLGVLIGSVSALAPAKVDSLLMRFTDVMMAIPTIPLLMIAALFFGGGILNIVLILALFGWMGTARLVRGNILSLREMDYIQVAQMMGASPWRVIWHHFIPNTMSTIVVSTTFRVAGAIIYESSLSYLGLGIQPPTPSWGNLLQRSMSYMFGTAFGGVPWWLVFFPGLFILLTALAVNFIGDGLRDAFDPKMVLRG
jgi:peptide/nickel transport system permease protein